MQHAILALSWTFLFIGMFLLPEEAGDMDIQIQRNWIYINFIATIVVGCIDQISNAIKSR